VGYSAHTGASYRDTYLNPVRDQEALPDLAANFSNYSASGKVPISDHLFSHVVVRQPAVQALWTTDPCTAPNKLHLILLSFDSVQRTSIGDEPSHVPVHIIYHIN
jgi:hypothetical protein